MTGDLGLIGHRRWQRVQAWVEEGTDTHPAVVPVVEALRERGLRIGVLSSRCG